jgi:hypothetical protein
MVFVGTASVNVVVGGVRKMWSGMLHHPLYSFELKVCSDKVKVYFIDHFKNGFLIFLTNVTKEQDRLLIYVFFILEKQWET